MSKRKRQQLKLRKERSAELAYTRKRQAEIKEAQKANALQRNYSYEVMTHTMAEIKNRKVRVRLRLPDMANFSSTGDTRIEKREH
jgi:hypothetical protein